jgi:excisionase family DNA binding protein
VQAEIVREWLTYKEAEQVVGLSTTTLWKLISAGEIEHRKVGRACLKPTATSSSDCGKWPRNRAPVLRASRH